MPVLFFSEDVPFVLRHRRLLRDWLLRLVQGERKTVGDINFIFCSDDYLLKINRDHLQHDYYTDVITFDYCSGNIISGDIYLSIDRIRDNARKMRLSPRQELHRVMAHGVLHLMGYGDKTEAQKKHMTRMEDKALTLLKF